MERLTAHTHHPHSEDQAVAAGRKAEEIVGDYLLNTLNGPLKKTQIWHDIRVPRPEGNGRYEIDFLLATPYGILVLEVKNFGGSLSIEAGSGRWLQVTSTQQKKSHEDPIALTAKKLEAVRIFLEKKGITCRPQNFHLRIVQTNPRVVFSREIASKSQVCRLEEIADAYYLLLPTKAGLLGIGKSSKAFANFRSVDRALCELPTWDEIELHGGKTLRGDIQASYGARLPRRSHASKVRLFVPKLFGPLQPCFAVFSMYFLGLIKIPFLRRMRADERIRIQLAGDPKTTEISALQVREIRYGSSGKRS